jgi:hypothetical protein
MGGEGIALPTLTWRALLLTLLKRVKQNTELGLQWGPVRVVRNTQGDDDQPGLYDRRELAVGDPPQSRGAPTDRTPALLRSPTNRSARTAGASASRGDHAGHAEGPSLGRPGGHLRTLPAGPLFHDGVSRSPLVRLLSTAYSARAADKRRASNSMPGADMRPRVNAALKVYAILTVALLLPAAAVAKDKVRDRPTPDYEHVISVAPIRLASPLLLLDYEQALSEKMSFSTGAGFGRFSTPWSRFVNDVADNAFSIRQVAARGAYNYHFKGFNRGWYVGATLEYDRYALTRGTDGTTAGSYSNLTLGPHIGYKIVGAKGLTFSWDTGPALQLGFGSEDAWEALFFRAPSLTLPLRYLGVGSLNLGWSF